jgi:hypothetical protein
MDFFIFFLLNEMEIEYPIPLKLHLEVDIKDTKGLGSRLLKITRRRLLQSETCSQTLF